MIVAWFDKLDIAGRYVYSGTNSFIEFVRKQIAFSPVANKLI